MARLDTAERHRFPWRVHDITADFVCDEVWSYPIRAVDARGEDFAAFLRFVESQSMPRGVVGMLFKVRHRLGAAFGWDRPGPPLAIPGCTETSLRDRLRPEERPPEHRLVPDAMGFTLVYDRPDERLLELSNATVHGALHLSWVDNGDGTHTPRLAVYWKARGAMGQAYMAAIGPFRRWIVYPGLMRAVGRAWARR